MRLSLPITVCLATIFGADAAFPDVCMSVSGGIPYIPTSQKPPFNKYGRCWLLEVLYKDFDRKSIAESSSKTGVTAEGRPLLRRAIYFRKTTEGLNAELFEKGRHLDMVMAEIAAALPQAMCGATAEIGHWGDEGPFVRAGGVIDYEFVAENSPSIMTVRIDTCEVPL